MNLLILSLSITAALAQSSKQTPGSQMEMLKQVAFDQRLNSQLPLTAEFRDHTGKQVRLGDYFIDKPVVLIPVYYECPMLCNLSMAGVVRAMNALTLRPQRDFQLVFFSFDPKDTPELAAEKRKAYLKRYLREGTEAGWHFLVGNEASIRELTEAIGFRYVFDETIKQYAHASGIVVATSKGRLSRYLYGMDYAAKDLRMGLVESAEGRIGDPIAQMLLMCFHYDPSSGKYTLGVLSALRALGVGTLLVMGGFVVASLRRERRGRKPAH